MQSYRKYCCGAAVFALNAFVLHQLPVQADEPTEKCHTHLQWVAEFGAGRAAAEGTCPPLGTCDSPPVRDSWIPDSSTPVVTIRIKFNVFCNDDGSNCASDSSGVSAQVSQLNDDFSPYRIQFIASETAFIETSVYREFQFIETIPMKSSYADDPGHQINVYVVDMPGSGTGSVQGFAIYPWTSLPLTNLGGIIVDYLSFGAEQRTLTHEVGHVLGLWHTHHGVDEVDPCSACYERADGLNGDMTGDFASETPPTPTNFSCDAPSGNDVCSETSWDINIQPENYMGYAPDSCLEPVS